MQFPARYKALVLFHVFDVAEQYCDQCGYSLLMSNGVKNYSRTFAKERKAILTTEKGAKLDAIAEDFAHEIRDDIFLRVESLISQGVTIASAQSVLGLFTPFSGHSPDIINYTNDDEDIIMSKKPQDKTTEEQQQPEQAQQGPVSIPDNVPPHMQSPVQPIADQVAKGEDEIKPLRIPADGFISDMAYGAMVFYAPKAQIDTALAIIANSFKDLISEVIGIKGDKLRKERLKFIQDNTPSKLHKKIEEEIDKANDPVEFAAYVTRKLFDAMVMANGAKLHYGGPTIKLPALAPKGIDSNAPIFAVAKGVIVGSTPRHNDAVQALNALRELADKMDIVYQEIREQEEPTLRSVMKASSFRLFQAMDRYSDSHAA